MAESRPAGSAEAETARLRRCVAELGAPLGLTGSGNDRLAFAGAAPLADVLRHLADTVAPARSEDDSVLFAMRIAPAAATG
ncbi:hypothetical protein [Streptomyces sp. NBC_01244]|uniref:hypothetical protein n=1 Tax=Streptomyces sp. NBC_01244 TaxID=2903797 RepID=UPI002E0ECBCF|nr:hypothetical protein OG247_00700 [Streptomyces sp. NBC_01244]